MSAPLARKVVLHYEGGIPKYSTKNGLNHSLLDAFTRENFKETSRPHSSYVSSLNKLVRCEFKLSVNYIAHLDKFNKGVIFLNYNKVLNDRN